MGTYFALNASYPVRYNFCRRGSDGKYRVLLSQVVTGQYTQGVKGMKVPPAKDPSKPLVLYESVVDDVADPAMYVIFRDAQAYPTYVITFS